jgi:hypothetical protein
VGSSPSESTKGCRTNEDLPISVILPIIRLYRLYNRLNCYICYMNYRIPYELIKIYRDKGIMLPPTSFITHIGSMCETGYDKFLYNAF